MERDKNFHLNLEKVIDSFPEAIYVKDKNRRLVCVNKAHARGVRKKDRRKEVVGLTDKDILAEKDYKAIDKMEKKNTQDKADAA